MNQAEQMIYAQAVEKVFELFIAGRQVRVLTDEGWLDGTVAENQEGFPHIIDIGGLAEIPVLGISRVEYL